MKAVKNSIVAFFYLLAAAMGLEQQNTTVVQENATAVEDQEGRLTFDLEFVSVQN